LLITLSAGVVTHDCFWLYEYKKGTRRKYADNSAAYARPMFPSTMARNQLFQILRVSRFSGKIASNKRRSADKLTPIIDVLENINRRFEVA
jgi:hypothetical protein